jgi:hypothetical protein
LCAEMVFLATISFVQKVFRRFSDSLLGSRTGLGRYLVRGPRDRAVPTHDHGSACGNWINPLSSGPQERHESGGPEAVDGR